MIGVSLGSFVGSLSEGMLRREQRRGMPATSSCFLDVLCLVCVQKQQLQVAVCEPLGWFTP
jgi:hypothetical protein